MEREYFHHAGLRFSYLDQDNNAQPGNAPAGKRVLIALHAHIMEATTFAPLAAALAPAWRVIALDQRGHGYSDHPSTYTREDYLGDLQALFEHLNLSEAVLLGNSLGGVNAYQFAAQHPEKVRGLIVEDIGAVIRDDLSFVLPWEGVFPTRDALVERVGTRFVPYLKDSFRQTPDGWKLAFDPRDIVESGKCLSGDYWPDWLATTCPALLIRGNESRVTTQEAAEQMATRRPHTVLKTLDGGHVVHFDNPAGYVDAVKEFLEREID